MDRIILQANSSEVKVNIDTNATLQSVYGARSGLKAGHPLGAIEEMMV
jgi:hypothetical protein